MRRRSRAGGERAKSQRHKAVTPKRRSAPESVGQETDLARRTRERDEALERETATSQVLRLISKSPGDLELVFRSILENATRICEAKFGALILREGDRFRFVAFHNAPPAYVELRTREPYVRLIAGTALARAVATKQAAQIADVTKHQPTRADPLRRSFAALTGARTLITVPMLKDDEIVGAINIYRQEVRSFADKQIGLLTNFATQAVIAIENTRLLNELRQRTTDLTESLEQQTATSEVLGLISSSPGELERVFQSILEKATRICEASFGTLFRFDGRDLQPVAQVGTPSELIEAQRRLRSPTPGGLLDLVIRTKRVIHTADRAADAIPGLAARFGGARSIVGVPMLKDDALVGAIAIYRQEVRPFSDKQIALVTNFAAQAALAIENTRLLNELRESLEQQTATADVLRVISSSPGELAPVFQTILQNATTLCEARFGALALCEGDAVRIRSLHNAPSAFAEFANRGPFHPGQKSRSVGQYGPSKSCMLRISERMRVILSVIRSLSLEPNSAAIGQY